MLAAALASVRKLLGVHTPARHAPKRPLDQESEEEYEETTYASEPQQKRRCTELDLPAPTPTTSNPAVQRFPWFTLKGAESTFANKMSSRSKKSETDAAEVIVVEESVQGGRHQRGPGTTRVRAALLAEEEDASKVLGRNQARKLCELATCRPPLPHSTLADFRFVPSTKQVKDQEAVRLGSENSNLSRSSQSQKKPMSSKAPTDFKGYLDRLWKKKSSSFLSSRIKHSMVQKSFRHEEKMRYRQLLQQYTEHCLAPGSRTPSHQVSSSLSSPVGMVTRSRMSPLWTKQKQDLLENASGEASPVRVLSYAGSAGFTELFKTSGMAEKEEALGRHPAQGAVGPARVPLVDLSKEDSEDTFASANESDSDSVIVVKEVLSPAAHRNSLEERLKEHAVYDLDWVKSMRKDYEERVQASAQDVDVTLKVIQDLEERRSRRASLDEKVTRQLQHLDLTFPSEYSELPDEEEEAFIPLTPEMESEVDNALKRTPASEVLIEKFRLRITRRDIATLAGLHWLNDEVINFYMNLIMERGQKDNYPAVYAFSTFFYPKLSKDGYQSVRRWTKKVDIFSYDMLLVPIHLGMHWCMAHVDFKMRCISYYDSMLGSNELCLRLLMEYLEAEHQDKKGSPYSTSDWKLENKKKIPQQMNGSDCGMFACKFAEYLSRRARIIFDQEHMPYFRRRMVYEIINGRLL